MSPLLRPLGPSGDPHYGYFKIAPARSVSVQGQLAANDLSANLWVQPTAHYRYWDGSAFSTVDRQALGSPLHLGGTETGEPTTLGAVVLQSTEAPFTIGGGPSIGSNVITVGTPPILSDGDVATYYQFDDADPDGTVSVMLPQLVLPPGAEVSSVGYFVRASSVDSGGLLGFSINGDVNPFGPFNIEPNAPSDADFVMTGGDTPTDYSGDISQANYDDFPGDGGLNGLVDQLLRNDGTYLTFSGLAGVDSVFKIHEASLTFYYFNPPSSTVSQPVEGWQEYVRYSKDVPVNATHWSLDLVLTRYHPSVSSEPPLDGTVLYVDCTYIPDNGMNLEGQPYLDGDQPGAIWEGTPHDATSTYSETPVDTPVFVISDNAVIFPDP